MYLVTKELPGLRLSPLGLKEERERSPRWLGNYSYININCKTLPIAVLSNIQYSRSPERLIRELVKSNPALGTVRILNTDISDGFYCIGLRPKDAPNLGLFFLLEG